MWRTPLTDTATLPGLVTLQASMTMVVLSIVGGDMSMSKGLCVNSVFVAPAWDDRATMADTRSPWCSAKSCTRTSWVAAASAVTLSTDVIDLRWAAKWMCHVV